MNQARANGAFGAPGYALNNRAGRYNGPQWVWNPGFVLPLGDAGDGAVDTALLRGAGSPTFTRATAAACRLSTGLWKLDVASGVARSHYYEFTAGTMTYGGYLSEPAATQILTAPRDMTNVAWTAGATITAAQDGTGIDGVANSCTRLTGGAVAATNTVLQTITAAASSRTYSAFIKRVTGTGAIGICQDGVTFTDISAQLTSTSFVQVQLNASQLNAVIGIQVSVAGDVILVDCNQFEAGEEATTPIPAAGGRNADVLDYTFAGNAAAGQGTIYTEMAVYHAATITTRNRPGIGFQIGTYGPTVFANNAVTTSGCFDGTAVANKSGLTSLATGVRKRASSYGAAGQLVTGDGAVVASGAFDGAMSSAAINIGHNNGGQILGGTIKNVKIATEQLSNSRLQMLTA